MKRSPYKKKLVDKALLTLHYKKFTTKIFPGYTGFLNNKEEAIAAAERSRNKALIKFYTDGDFSATGKRSG
jgi:hypothetical protein